MVEHGGCSSGNTAVLKFMLPGTYRIEVIVAAYPFKGGEPIILAVKDVKWEIAPR